MEVQLQAGYTVQPSHFGWQASPGVYARRIKRVVDLCLGVVGLLGSLPVWIAIAIAIRLDSKGPVLFRQERVGRGGRRIWIYKFRSMHEDADARLAVLRELNEADGPVFKIRNDPRVTRVGRVLRRTSLDELPQLINVIRGEMSIVGPRPPLASEVALYRPADMVRLSVTPGLTCLWQISGRSDCGFERWMELDRAYIRNLSPWLDAMIILRTVLVVLSCRGAY